MLLVVTAAVKSASCQEYENSPFGFDPASVFEPGYPNNGFLDDQYIGVKLNRPSVATFWFIGQPDLANTSLDFNMCYQVYGSVPEDMHILVNIAPQSRFDEGYCIPAFCLMEGFKYDGGYFDFTELICDDWGLYDQGLGVKIPSYFTYKKMTEILEGSDWENVQTIDTGIENVYCYSFLKNKSSILVAWYDYFDDPGCTSGDPIEFILNDISSDQVIVTNAVPFDTLYSAFYIDTLPVTGGSVQIELGESPVFIEDFSATSTEEEITVAGIRLHQNCPNSFNSMTTISFTTEEFMYNTELVIDNISGRIVKTLVDSALPDGEHSVSWNGRDENNRPVGSGVYFYHLRAGNGTSESRRMVLIK